MKANLIKRGAMILSAVLLTAGAVAFAADPAAPSALLQEFFARDKKRLNQAQAGAIAFMKELKFQTDDIIELEILDADGRFVLRNQKDQVCLGSPVQFLLRCKNKMGITTVTFQGDAD